MTIYNNNDLKLKRYAINNLALRSYRNFKHYEVNTNIKPVIILGDNGVGKTNILESISLLAPGRGLKNVKFDDICNQNLKNTEPFWQIDANLVNNFGEIHLSSYFNFQQSNSKRSIFFNGTKINNTELSELNSVIWLTPQMDYLFFNTSSERRKFFDRMVYTFETQHSSSINKYDYYLRERSILLQTNGDKKWLELIENNIAETATSITYARLQTLHALQQATTLFESAFPKAQIELNGDLELIANNYTALELEELIRQKLYSNRDIDFQTKRTNFGPHRTDLIAYHPDNHKPAHLCSTGEQKALLISIILAEIYAKTWWTHIIPIVLLDEITVHLDQIRRDSLIEHLTKTNAQFWLTANNLNQIGNIDNVHIINL